ncbi:MAG: TolC family protein [Bacteroidaceae bacterium]|nr:TolC family protein [Bacteroidaceae bacterium]
MKKNICFIYFMLFIMFPIQARVLTDSLTVNTNEETEESITAGFLDGKIGPMGIDYSSFKLPPLGTLFENAAQTPSIQLLEKERQLAKKLLNKEKRKFLEFFRVHGNYSYGNTTSTSTSTDISTPLYSFASGYESSYWNVGASVNIGLESLMDLKGKINRGRLEVEKAEIKKEVELDKLKQQIASIYVRITNNLIALKTAAEYAASYRGAGLMTEQRFRNNQIDIKELADVRRLENDAIGTYQEIQAQISTDIIMLEILTHTPIITQLTIDNQ